MLNHSSVRGYFSRKCALKPSSASSLDHASLFCMPVLCCARVAHFDSMDRSLPGSSVLGNSLGKNTGGGCYALLQGIFPTQGSKPGLPHCRQILYSLSHRVREAPKLPLLQPIQKGAREDEMVGWHH